MACMETCDGRTHEHTHTHILHTHTLPGHGERLWRSCRRVGGPRFGEDGLGDAQRRRGDWELVELYKVFFVCLHSVCLKYV